MRAYAIRAAVLGAVLSFAPIASAADAVVKLTGVHNACERCGLAIADAVGKAGGVAVVDKSTVTITAADDAALKKAVAALLAAGYFGEGADAGPAASDVKAKAVQVEGPQLLCPKCVEAFNRAALSAPGAAKSDAGWLSKHIFVNGDVSPKDVQDALHKAGFNGTMVK